MRRVLSGVLAIGAVVLNAVVGAMPSAAAEELTIEGEIIDPAGYLKSGARGPDLVDQTYLALDGGQSLALLDPATQTLYFLLAEEPGEDPNELVYDYVSQKVRATGTVYERDGVRGIVLTSAEPLENAGAAPSTELAPPED
ncbi:MAG: hypothetical protein COV75_08025 [Candidatus Omnitrophica bacterium CG11_big_fil_rev_8_21_14_0_20_63_9]|nr:MAG: hypothetical protein COV75_08025 [Candidatus Omnitrophica bacterium CG11_big_fil_rev_8_21_14_0_20_63_9]